MLEQPLSNSAATPTTDKLTISNLLPFDGILYMPGIAAKLVKKGTTLNGIATQPSQAVLIDPATWKRYKLVETIKLVEDKA